MKNHLLTGISSALVVVSFLFLTACDGGGGDGDFELALTVNVDQAAPTFAKDLRLLRDLGKINLTLVFDDGRELSTEVNANYFFRSDNVISYKFEEAYFDLETTPEKCRNECRVRYGDECKETYEVCEPAEYDRLYICDLERVKVSFSTIEGTSWGEVEEEDEIVAPHATEVIELATEVVTRTTVYPAGSQICRGEYSYCETVEETEEFEEDVVYVHGTVNLKPID